MLNLNFMKYQFRSYSQKYLFVTLGLLHFVFALFLRLGLDYCFCLLTKHSWEDTSRPLLSVLTSSQVILNLGLSMGGHFVMLITILLCIP